VEACSLGIDFRRDRLGEAGLEGDFSRCCEEAAPEDPDFLDPLTVIFGTSRVLNGECSLFAFPFLLLDEYVFWTAPRVCRLSEGGCNSRGM
jgi:hypothetical protein